MRLIDADALKEEINKKKVVGRFNTLLLIDNAPTVDTFTFDDMKKGLDVGYSWGYSTGKCQRPQGELTEINHRLNLLIGVLYTNQLISDSDLKYIEDSIKKLMKGGAE